AIEEHEKGESSQRKYKSSGIRRGTQTSHFQKSTPHLQTSTLAHPRPLQRFGTLFSSGTERGTEARVARGPESVNEYASGSRIALYKLLAWSCID
ncbi:933_t:CDS:2, partial [Acaulospora colombiana]